MIPKAAADWGRVAVALLFLLPPDALWVVYCWVWTWVSSLIIVLVGPDETNDETDVPLDFKYSRVEE